MTNQEYTKCATDKWMKLFKKKSTLSKQDLDTMETLITYIIEGALQFKEQQLIDKVCEWIKEHNGDYISIVPYDHLTNDFYDDLRKSMKGE